MLYFQVDMSPVRLKNRVITLAVRCRCWACRIAIADSIQRGRERWSPDRRDYDVNELCVNVVRWQGGNIVGLMRCLTNIYAGRGNLNVCH